jgi:hypothetical protein
MHPPESLLYEWLTEWMTDKCEFSPPYSVKWNFTLKKDLKYDCNLESQSWEIKFLLV